MRISRPAFRAVWQQIAVAWLCSLGTSTPTLALDPSTPVWRYHHTIWRVPDSGLSARPFALAQTPDGFLWIGTEAGLLRFDGVSFVKWPGPGGDVLPSETIGALTTTRDGSLWIGTDRGLARWANGRLVTYAAGPGISRIVESADGVVWVSRYRVVDGQGPVCEVAGSGLRCYGPADGMPFRFVSALARDGRGGLWVGSHGLCRWRPGSTCSEWRPQVGAPSADGVNALAIDPDGALLAADSAGAGKPGLSRFERGVWREYRAPGFDARRVSVVALLVDRDKGLWIGTLGSGLYRVADERVEHFSSADGLSSNDVWAVFEDREGVVWAATSGGLDAFHVTPVETITRRDGLVDDSVLALLAARSGGIWVGQSGALLNLADTGASAPAAQLPGGTVHGLLEDRDGLLWVASNYGLSVYARRQFRPIARADGSALGVVGAMAEDANGSVWVNTIPLEGRSRLIRIHDFKVKEEWFPPQGSSVRSLAADREGGLWLGYADGALERYRDGRTERARGGDGSGKAIEHILSEPDGSVWAASGTGLLRWKDGRLAQLDEKHGLPCNAIYDIVRDTSQSLWLWGACGIVVISADDLTRWVTQPAVRVEARMVGPGDLTGVVRPASHAAGRSRDGRLWFLNAGTLRVVNPERMTRNANAPPVHIERIVGDRRVYSARDNVRLPPRIRDLQIDYTAASLVAPRQVRFRYRLEGRDGEWREAGARRQAFYTDLPPGHYTFRVSAANGDGVWNAEGASWSFAIAPAYYQTGWWRALCVSAVGVALWTGYRLRVRRVLRSVEVRLESRLLERERIARDLHDTLLQGVCGLILRFQAVAEHIPSGEPARGLLDETLDRADEVVRESRHRVEGLRTRARESSDLPQAFAQVGRDLAHHDGPSLRVIVEGRPEPLNVVVWDEAFLIGREALINAFHAADAARVEVELTYARREMRLRVRDDGRGIAAGVLADGGRPGHWGIRGMRERAERIGARLEIASRPGAGTEIDLRVPAAHAYGRSAGPLTRAWFRGARSHGE